MTKLLSAVLLLCCGSIFSLVIARLREHDSYAFSDAIKWTVCISFLIATGFYILALTNLRRVIKLFANLRK